MTIGERISAFRDAKHLSPEKLAGLLGVPARLVYDWEADKSLPGEEYKEALTGILGMTREELEQQGTATRFCLVSPYMDMRQMYETLDSVAKRYGYRQTQAAASYMHFRHSHIRQKRVSRYGFECSYEVHPLTVACHALGLGIADDDVLAACLLHDVVEDTGVTTEEFPDEIGELVRETVGLLSYNTYLQGPDLEDPEKKESIKWQYYRNIREHPLASLVKCLDRCHNLSDLADSFRKEKMVRYIRETEVMVMPLLDTVEHVLDWKQAAWMIRYQMLTTIEIYKRLI